MSSLIVTTKMNDFDPQARLADMLAEPLEMPLSRLHELPQRNWKRKGDNAKTA